MPASVMRPRGQDDDAVGAPHGAEAVRDQQTGAALAVVAEPVVHIGLGLRVESRTRLVQDQQIAVDPQERAGQCDAPALPAGQQSAGAPVAFAGLREAAAQERVVTVGQSAQRLVDARPVGGGPDARSVAERREVADGDVLGRREVVAHEVLEHGSEPVAQLTHRHVADVDAVPQDRAAGGVVEPAQQFDQGALARAIAAHEGDGPPVGNVEIDAAQDPGVAVGVAEPHVP